MSSSNNSGMGNIAFVSEEMVAEHVAPAAVFDVVEAVFASMYKESARNFPVVREQLGYADAVYGFKSGFDKTKPLLGVKAGGYWPGNAAKGIANHQSTVVLFDPDTGQLSALVSGNRLTALRTAAAAAVSIKHLARSNAETLGIVGAGGQSPFQVRAAITQRGFKRLMIANRTVEKAQALADSLKDLDVEITVASAEEVVRASDVVITIVSSWEAQIKSEWVSAGTHVVCMGTDTKGKQEVEAALVARSQAFTDEIAQAITIGECQHAYAAGDLPKEAITPIGAVIDGAHGGRASDDAITLFDSTGVGLQDLVAAQLALDLVGK